MDDEPIELAAYAIMRPGRRIIGFVSVDQANRWRDDHDDWMEFGWSEEQFGEWKIERRRAEEERCRPKCPARRHAKPVEPAPDSR